MQKESIGKLEEEEEAATAGPGREKAAQAGGGGWALGSRASEGHVHGPWDCPRVG